MNHYATFVIHTPVVKDGMVWLYGTARHCTVRYATLRCATLRYATLRYATVRYATLRYATLRYGVVWCVSVSYVMVYSMCTISPHPCSQRL